MDNAPRDGNFEPTLLGTNSTEVDAPNPSTVTIAVNPTTHAVIVELA